MIGVQSVTALEGYRLRVEFTNGVERVVDVERFLRGPVFDAVRRDRKMFEAATVDPELKAIVWPNGADIDPDVLYGRFEPAWADDEPRQGAARPAHQACLWESPFSDAVDFDPLTEILASAFIVHPASPRTAPA